VEYHEQISLGLVGEIELDVLQKAWNFVIQTNEMLRTVHRWKGIDKPMQLILKNHPVAMHYHDLSGESNLLIERKLAEIKEADLKRRIDIENETLRITLCKYTTDNYTMILSNHHILFDGWSSSIMIKELIGAYNTLYQGLEADVIVKNKFSEYVKWIELQDKKRQKNYWEQYLLGAPQNDDLFSRAHQSEMRNYKCVIGEDVSKRLAEFAKANALTVASFFYAVWGVVAAKLNNTNEIVFGITTSGRHHPIIGIESMVGLFINTIPLRIRTDEEETIIQLLNKVNQIIKEGQEFASTPLVAINDYTQISSGSQLFNSLVVIENYPLNMADYQDGVLVINDYSAIPRTNYNLTIGITLTETIELDFQCNCFTDEGVIKRISDYCETVISTILADKESKVIDIDILSEAEKHQLLYEFNDTYADYPREKTIHQLFEERAALVPDAKALVFNEESMTYARLNTRANQVARILQETGVACESIVGLVAQRSPEVVIGVIAILKAGGAFLPIDPEYPKQRINFMLEDSGADILLITSQLYDQIPFAGKKINLNAVEFEDDEVYLESVNNPHDLAYVIYTSGSTGTPKGVMVEHSSAINFIVGQTKRYEVNKDDQLILLSSISFDAAVEQIFMPLFCGATLHLIDSETILDNIKFTAFMANNGITHLFAVSSFLESLDLNSLDQLRVVLAAGEVFPISLLKNLSPKIKIYNGYGPTEATIGTAVYLVKREKVSRSVPIGKPITNYQVYILDINKKPQPIGIPGELYIGGVGVTRGYLGRSELTAEKFLPNPFASKDQKSEIKPQTERIYRTGDLAYFLPDGNIEFLGRIDQQVKVRGLE